MTMITYHRNPTAAEIKFGYGCLIHRDFAKAEVTKADGKIKCWTICPDTGYRYYRS